jgi:hypothetical protein
MNTDRGTRDFIMLFTKNNNGLQDGKDAFAMILYDQSAEKPTNQPFNASFEDINLVAGIVFGTLTFEEPSDVGMIQQYALYFAEDATGTGRVYIASTTVESPQISVPFTSRGSLDWILLYSKNANGDQDFPWTGPFYDDTGAPPTSSVSDVQFTDDDTVGGTLTGFASWSEPADIAEIEVYAVYLAEDASGAQQQLVGTYPRNCDSGQCSFFLNAVARGRRDFILVYAQNSYGLGPMPAAASFQFYDASSDVPPSYSQVQNLEFTDVDNDIDEIGGDVTWTVASDLATYRSYVLEIGRDAEGADKTFIKSLMNPQAVKLTIDDSTLRVSSDFVLVYCANDIGNQLVPASGHLYDASNLIPVVTVSDVVLTDVDSELYELSGDVSWTPPDDAGTVLHYAMYLAEDVDGLNKAKVGDDV